MQSLCRGKDGETLQRGDQRKIFLKIYSNTKEGLHLYTKYNVSVLIINF
jgi:hypothetical protein